ncbi:MAG: prephenate dehydrogenase/arogenate dehydrogenase family protein [Anaerolineales bacterium]
MKVQLLFVGLQEIGTSLAMALAEASVDATRIGYDRDKQAARAAQASGAIDKLVLNPYKAARTADMVILTLPAADADQFLEDVAGNLKPKGAILDCSPLKASSFHWAAEHIPDAYYLGAIPVVRFDVLHQLETSYEDARPDLFTDSQFALVVPADLPERILNITINVADAIGAQPFFLDAAEMDAVTSLIDTAPAALGLALLRTASGSRGWPDIQRLAGRPFAAGAYHAGQQEAAHLSKKLLANSQSLSVHLGAISDELETLRGLLADGDEEGLTEYVGDALAAHDKWLAKRERADWEGDELSKAKISGVGMIGNLFGFDPRRGKRDE